MNYRDLREMPLPELQQISKEAERIDAARRRELTKAKR